MSFPINSKATAPSAPTSIADEEQVTFGQQAPFAAASSLAPFPKASTEHPQADTMNQAYQAPPPTYDEVTRAPGAPQMPNNNSYSDQPESSEHHSPSAPLLAPGAQGSNGYSSIPPPPPRSYASSVSSYTSSTDPDRARRFNKFWIIFFAVVVILLIFDDDRQEGVCSEDRMLRRIASNYHCSDALVDFTINVSGVEGLITVEQDENAKNTLFSAEVVASDRDRLFSIKPSLQQSEKDGIFLSSTTTNAKYQGAGCVYINLRIVFAGHHKQIRKLKIASLEGNVTINMKDSQAEFLELESKVITGHSVINAKVSSNAHIGGSVGSIRGDLVLGKEFAVNLVQGPVILNLAKAPSSRAMQGKVVATQGNVTVGLVPHYEGVYTVESAAGEVALQNINADRTVITKQSSTRITGWNSEDRREPKGPTSELKVQTTRGNAILSFTPMELK
ncbi:hypothetical protein CPC16_001300 [Podila verticillata]|nr:hypothetical protein CPC16_001300 [Podila verticillata]KFH63547.1 hypothetical protein MVEG_10956 [Podila verticillata NRRL 6337]